MTVLLVIEQRLPGLGTVVVSETLNPAALEPEGHHILKFQVETLQKVLQSKIASVTPPFRPSQPNTTQL